ncbi:probable E3 ubiquitin-protein ligase HERC3 [Megalops cyprinoides]|uniref:probable E3 ubiquitin-protein ligase HERC3 n=1 Tax=Megalops cyprinoides TaxID=118141 RepID=UPI001863B783|nr:probable E3 ubiquitin-protein ligase HERC3 [Megalops cyprinoides]
MDEKRNSGNPKRLALKEKIQSLSCGASHIVLVSERGNVFQLDCDETRSVPRLCINDRQVIQVACGDHHTIALSKEGEVFTWGSNSNGQLGLGHVVSSPLTPRPVTLLSGMPLSQISAGGDQSFALSSSGAVFGWGKNNTGQLGLGDMEDRYCPTPVDSLNLKRTVSISCGEEHTAILNKGGLVFTFGSGRYGQLGHNSNRNELRPRLVAELWGSRVTQLACGRHHTLAYVSSSNTIYSFGCGEQRQLGNGQTSNQNVPLPVQLSPDEELINKWISECDSRPWKSLKREITKTFSSASCLNGSFLQSNDKHYLTATDNPGLDLSLARLAFEKLAKKDKVLTQIGSVVQQRLIPSLQLLPANVEALRVYLILPELLRVLQTQQRELSVAFAAAIFNLSLLHPNVLEDLWSKLPKPFFKTLVKIFHTVSTWYLNQMRTEQTDHWVSVAMTVNVLQKLYEVNYRAGRKIEDSNFYISEMKLFIKSVKFEQEDGIDHGGVSQEFFSIIAREVNCLDPRVFEFFEDSRLVWFTPEGHCDHDAFYLLGVLCGMALYNFCVVNFHFPLALFKKLLGFPPTLEDLKELSPIEARSLQGVLIEDEDVVEVLDLDFTVKGHEIVPCGRDIPVTKSNRQQYVDAYIDFVFNKSVRRQFEDFLKGFSKGCPNEKWRMFLPEELMALLTGNIDYEWEELKKNTKYVGYKATDPNIQNFWTVFEELSEEQKKHFLSFMTGSDRLPVGGLSKMWMTIMNQNKDDPDNYYPVANTCYCVLYLPHYSNIDVLREKFMHAITFYEEFGEL